MDFNMEVTFRKMFCQLMSNLLNFGMRVWVSSNFYNFPLRYEII